MATTPEQTAVLAISAVMNGSKDVAEEFLNALSREDLWYVKERLEETYSLAAYLHEIREDV